MGKRNQKAAERRRQKTLEKKKRRRANPDMKRRKGRGKKLGVQSPSENTASGEALSEEVLEGLLQEAMALKGDLIPQTEEEVKAFEEAVNLSKIEIPEALENPPTPPTLKVSAEEGVDDQDPSTPFASVQGALDALPYDEMNVTQLKKAASSLGVAGYSKMRKGELIEACKEAGQ